MNFLSYIGRRSNTNFAPLGSALLKKQRFYKKVDILRDDSESKPMFKVTLDGRVLKTQGGKQLKVDSEPLALAIAEEWAGQTQNLEIASMRLTGLAFTATDNPLKCTPASIASKLLEYVESDTVLYHNEESRSLHDAQVKHWNPLIENTNKELGTVLKPTGNIFGPEISAEDKAKFERWILSLNEWSLHGLQYATETAKSLIIAFNVLNWKITADEAIELATLERRVQSKIWGAVEWHHGLEDEELLSRLSAACLFVYLNSNNSFDKPL
ncbi:unnamed protein product, partial [Mesorhabditis spiculigera]